MFWVSSGWQTVGRSLVKLANSWSVYGNVGKTFWAIFDNVGKQLGSLWQCWQTVGQSFEGQIRTWSSLWCWEKQEENKEGKNKKEETRWIFNPSLVRLTHLSQFNSFELKWVIWVFLQACQTRALPLFFSTKLCPLVYHLIDINMKTPKYYFCTIFPLREIQQICQTQLLII